MKAQLSTLAARIIVTDWYKEDGFNNISPVQSLDDIVEGQMDMIRVAREEFICGKEDDLTITFEDGSYYLSD